MKNVKLEKGITLIALIITIIILLILAVVTIGSMKNSNIITYAQNASSDYNREKDKEESTIAGYESLIENSILEDSKDWSLAYYCKNGAWVNEPVEQGEIIPEDATIVAYFYKTGKMITPTFEDGSFSKGEEYRIVIEGTGDMPILVDGETGNAWQEEVWVWAAEEEKTFTPKFFYVTEATIANGITNIGVGAFNGCYSLKKINIASSVTKIEESVFLECFNLIDIILPDSITEIGDGAFENCFGLTSITIPSSVTRIEDGAFLTCKSLKKVKILSTSIDIDTYSSQAFGALAENSVIYVLNNEVKQELEGQYDSKNTTVTVVTQEEMNNI